MDCDGETEGREGRSEGERQLMVLYAESVQTTVPGNQWQH